MPSETLFVIALVVIVALLLLLTPIASFAFSQVFIHLGIYHPTPSLAEQYVDDACEHSPDEYETEPPLKKAFITAGINLVCVFCVELTLLAYLVFLVGGKLTFRTIFATGVFIIAMNSILRVTFLHRTPFGRSGSTADWSAHILKFGASFYTSLFIFAALGYLVAGMNGTATAAVSATISAGLGGYWQAVTWAAIFLVSVPLISYGAERINATMIGPDAVTWELREGGIHDPRSERS